MNKKSDYSNLKVPCDIYSRVCGYFQPTRQWNNGKKQEYKDRLEYNVNKALEKI